MIQLTKAEEQIMQILWSLKESTVQDIREKFEHPKPARTTIATVLSVLENKGFISHKTFGRVNVYSPVIQKENYSKAQLFGIMKDYFNNSFVSMASFFAKEKNLSLEDLDELLNETKEEIQKQQKKKKQ